jgi:Flp pilus assembly protein TadG
MGATIPQRPPARVSPQQLVEVVAMFYSTRCKTTARVRLLRADQRGTVIVMMGLLFPILIGGLGLGFEVSNWYLQTRAMQNAADSAALAAAANASANYAVEAKAVAAQYYGFVDGTNNVTVKPLNNVTCPDGSNTCYSVTITSMVPLYLSQVVGYSGDTTVNGVKEKTLGSAAIAQPKIQQALCLLALSKTGTALRTNGAPNSNFTGCSVMSDSASTCNGSNLNANYGLAHGSNSGCGNKEESNIPTVDDPYKAMAANIPTNTCGTKANNFPQLTKNGSKWSGGTSWSGSKNLNGTLQMCGDVQLTGNVVINTPNNTTGAVLVIENGQLDLNGFTLSTANGSAVTIVFSGVTTNPTGNYQHIPTDNSSGQGGVLDIQAPSGSSALFQGMAIYQDPNLTTGVDITYKGNNPDWKISGGVYLPNSNVQISGAVSQSTNGADCFAMITSTVWINGTSNIYQQSPDGSDCKNKAGLNIPTATIRRNQLVN